MIDLDTSVCMIHIDVLAFDECYTCSHMPLRHVTNTLEQWKYVYLCMKGDMTPLRSAVEAYNNVWFMKLSSVSVNPR